MGEIKCVLYAPENINWKARANALALMMVPDAPLEKPEPKRMETWVAVVFAGMSMVLLGITVTRLIS